MLTLRGMHRSAPVEGEQRCVVVQPHAITSALQLLAISFADARAVQDKPTLAELAALHDEQAAGAVDVTDTQRARLTHAQPQPVAEGEDRAIGLTALGLACNQGARRLHRAAVALG